LSWSSPQGSSLPSAVLLQNVVGASSRVYLEPTYIAFSESNLHDQTSNSNGQVMCGSPAVGQLAHGHSIGSGTSASTGSSHEQKHCHRGVVLPAAELVVVLYNICERTLCDRCCLEGSIRPCRMEIPRQMSRSCRADRIEMVHRMRLPFAVNSFECWLMPVTAAHFTAGPTRSRRAVCTNWLVAAHIARRRLQIRTPPSLTGVHQHLSAYLVKDWL